jgi:hypothetical protein
MLRWEETKGEIMGDAMSADKGEYNRMMSSTG